LSFISRNLYFHQNRQEIKYPSVSSKNIRKLKLIFFVFELMENPEKSRKRRVRKRITHSKLHSKKEKTSFSSSVEFSEHASRVRFRKKHKEQGAGPHKYKYAPILKKQPRTSSPNKAPVPDYDPIKDNEKYESWIQLADTIQKQSIQNATTNIQYFIDCFANIKKIMPQLIPVGMDPCSWYMYPFLERGLLKIFKREKNIQFVNKMIDKLNDYLRVTDLEISDIGDYVECAMETAFDVERNQEYENRDDDSYLVDDATLIRLGANKLMFESYWLHVLDQANQIKNMMETMTDHPDKEYLMAVLDALVVFWFSTNPDFYNSPLECIEGNDYMVESEHPENTNSIFEIAVQDSNSNFIDSSAQSRIRIKPVFTNGSRDATNVICNPKLNDSKFTFGEYVKDVEMTDKKNNPFAFSVATTSPDAWQATISMAPTLKYTKRTTFTITFPVRSGLFIQRLGEASLLQARECHRKHYQCAIHTKALGLCPRERENQRKKYNQCTEKDKNKCSFVVSIQKKGMSKA